MITTIENNDVCEGSAKTKRDCRYYVNNVCTFRGYLCYWNGRGESEKQRFNMTNEEFNEFIEGK